MERPFVQENALQRERLRPLVSRLSAQDLARPLDSAWTLPAALAHLAFWDYRPLVLVNRWKETGVGPSPIDIDGVNDALLPLCLALPPRTAANLAVSAAEAIDGALEQASDDLIAAIEGLGGKFRLRRAEHRQYHLDEIEAVLK